MKALTSTSDFLSFMPAELIQWDLQARRIAKLDIEIPGAVRHMGITRRRGAVLSPVAEALQEALREISTGGALGGGR